MGVSVRWALAVLTGVSYQNFELQFFFPLAFVFVSIVIFRGSDRKWSMKKMSDSD